MAIDSSESIASTESINIKKYRGVRYKPVPEEENDTTERYVVWGPDFVERLWREGNHDKVELAVIDELPETQYRKVVEIAEIAGFSIINGRQSPHLSRIQWCTGIHSLDQLNSIHRQFEGQAVLVHVDDNVPWELYQQILYEAVLKGYVVTNSGPHRDKDKFSIPLDKSKFEAELCEIRERTVKEMERRTELDTDRRFLLGYETASAQVISERFGWYMGAAERELVAEDTVKSVDEELNGLRKELQLCESFLSICLRDHENSVGHYMEELQQKMSNLMADSQRVARAESMLKDRLQHQEATRNLKVVDMGKRNIWEMGKKYMWSCIGISTSVGLCLLVSAHHPKAGESNLHRPRQTG